MDNRIREAEKGLTELYARADEIALFNQRKVLNAFKKNRIALRHFAPTTGYGYSDEGREALSKVFADVFGAESALVSPSIVSGTHAISLALSGILRPSDLFVSVTGEPYDTLKEAINGENNGSLKDYGVRFEVLPLVNGKIDEKTVVEYVKRNNPKMVYIQRSRGYEWRDSLSVGEIENCCKSLRNIGYDNCIFVDNCYGEFVEIREPSEVGADVICGSLIKNAGGGIAPTGGYVIGKRKYIEAVENRFTSPSIGAEVGSYAASYRPFFQGLFLAPHVVCQAVKGNLLIGRVMENLGYKTSPETRDLPCDITRSVRFEKKEELISFIQSVQSASPVDGYLTLEPWAMPGYAHEVIMAAGCFVQGASIELSADAPIKEPFTAYVQGGLTYEHCVIALEEILSKLK